MQTPGTCPQCSQDASPHTDLSFFDNGAIEVSYHCACGCRFLETYELNGTVEIEDGPEEGDV